MTWGEWCVSTLSDSQEFEAEKYKRIVYGLAGSDPNQLATVAAGLVRQNMQLETVLSKAARHIAALEIARDLSEDPRLRVQMHPTKSLYRNIVDQIVSRLPWWQSAA